MFRYLNRFAIAIVALTGLVLWTGEVKSQEVETREVMVTSTRTERNLMEVPMSVSVKNSEDLTRDPKNSVADLLSDIPGVEIADGSMPGSKRVLIRGESSARSLILVDGVKISEQKSMNGPVILIDTSQIERVEVIKGPMSVLYGSEAIGGVINIISKKGGDKPVAFSVNTVADSSTQSLEVQTALFGAYNGWNYRFSASGIEAGNRRTPNETIERSSFRNRFYTGRVGYDWDGGKFYVKADYFDSVIHIPTNYGSGIVWADSRSTRMNNETAVSLDLPKWERSSISTGLELYDLTANLARLKFEAYYQNMKKDFYNNVRTYNYFHIPAFNRTLSVTVNPFTHTFNDQDSIGGSLQTDWSLGDHFLIAGFDYNRDDLTADDDRLGGTVTAYTPRTGWMLPPWTNPWQTTVTNIDKYSYRYKASQDTMGLFAQDEWKIGAGFTTTLGLRQTWVKSSMSNTGGNPDLPAGRSIDDSRLVANAGLVYTGVDDLSLRALWGQGYRFPPLNELYLGTVHGSTGATLPNPDLEPETSDNFEIGARFNNGAWDIDLAAFYSTTKNLITTTSLSTGNSQFVNMDKADTFGIELALAYTFESAGLTPYVSATYLNRKVKNTIDAPKMGGNNNSTKFSERITYETDKTGHSPLFGRIGVKYEVPFDGDKLFTSDLYVDWATKAKEYYYDTTYLHGDPLPSTNSNYGFVTQEHEAWQTLNLTLGMQWGTEHKWHATVAFRNILDQQYTRSTNVIADPGFHLIAGVGFEY
ncbi:MAG: TonB-dependent receptor [Deltaproteobacteria bacterium]|jgi:hemoglobin/transferrin/lactoferrin receptor protein|nr:TonB-dependent receptor [Deltaproteobacteria bacterium]